MKVFQTQALVQLRTSLASSDNPLLTKILQSIDAATSDEHLFEVTLKLLKSLCVCMRDTLKAKEDTYNSAKNLIGLSKTVSTEGKVLDLYKKIYNNTCFNLKHDLSKRSNASSESWNHSNCGKEDRLKENNSPKNEEDSQTMKNVLRSKLEHILYRALVQTRHHHKYNIKKYNLFGKAKSRVKSSLKHTLIVILTLHPAHKDLRKYNVVEEDLHKVLHKNSTIDIDIIDTKYDQRGKESEEVVKPEVYLDCHLQSLYTYLAESEKKNLTKVFRFLRRRDTIKIYIEVFTGRNHSDYINICCTNGSISALCKKELIEYIDSQENITVQYKTIDNGKSIALKNHLKNTIAKLKQLVKRLDFKPYNISTIKLNIRNVDISKNITSANEMKNDFLAMNNNNSVTFQLGQPNDPPNFVENLTHPLKLRDVSRAIILLNDFVSKQTTTDDIKSPGSNQADQKQVDLMNSLSLTEIPLRELSPTTTSNLALLEESATIFGNEIETSHDTIYTMTVKEQDGLNVNNNMALQLNHTGLPTMPKNLKIKTHNNASTIPHDQVTTKSSGPKDMFKNLDNNITTSDINTKMVPINKLQHKLSSFRTLKDIFPGHSTISYEVNLTNMRYTKKNPSDSNKHDAKLILKDDNNIFSKNQVEITREIEKDTPNFKFKENNSPVTDDKPKPTSLLKFKIRNDTLKPFKFSISKRPKSVSNVNFPRVQQATKQDTLTTHHKNGNSNKLNKQYYQEQSTKSVSNAKTFQKYIVTLQVAVNNSSILANSSNPETTKNWKIKKNNKKTASKSSNILDPDSKIKHIDPLRPDHKQKLPNQNAINYSNTLSKHDKQTNILVSTRSSFTSITKSIKIFLTPKNDFNIIATTTITEKPINSTKIPITQVSKEKQMKLPTKIYNSRIGIDQNLLLEKNNSNVNSDSLNTSHLGAAANRSSYKHLPTHTWLSMTTNKTAFNVTSKELQYPVTSNAISEAKNTVTSINKRLEFSNNTTQKINNIFENTIKESYPAADSLVSDSIHTNGIRREPVTVVSIQSIMPFIKPVRIPTKPISSDENKYHKYTNLTGNLALILNPTVSDQIKEAVKIKDSKTKTIIANMERNSQSVTIVPHYYRTKTFKEPSSFLSRDKNKVLNLTNMINNRDVDIKTLSSATKFHSNPLYNRNKIIIGKSSKQKTSFKNYEIEEFSTNNSTMVQIKKSVLQNIYTHAESSISDFTNNTVSSTKSRTVYIDDDKMITIKQKLKETLTSSKTELIKDTSTSTPKKHTINYRDRDPIENTINFIETFEDQIELNIPINKNNTTENSKPKNIETKTKTAILARTTKDKDYSIRSRNESKKYKSNIYNLVNVGDEKAIMNLSVFSVNGIKMSTTPMKYTLPNTKKVIYQEPLMLTKAILFGTSPITQKYNQSSSTPLDKIENTSDQKNILKDMVKDKKVLQKHNIETSSNSEKYGLLNTKAAISVESYNAMVNSVSDTTINELYDVERTWNTEFNPISDEDDNTEFLTTPLFAKNDENIGPYTTIAPEILQYNYINTYENAGKNTVSEINESLIKEPYDFDFTENIVSQKSPEIINYNNKTIENNIDRSKLTIIPIKPTLSLQNMALFPKSTLTYSKKNINNTISMINSTDTISSTKWSTTKNYGSNTMNIDNITKETNMLTNPTGTGNTVQAFDTITQAMPFKKPYKLADTENTEFDNIPDTLYDEWLATNSDNTVEILNSKNSKTVKTKIMDLNTTPTLSQQKTKKFSNNTSKYNSKNTKDTMVTESYKAIPDTRNFNITNTTRSITKTYENNASSVRYIDHVNKITSNRNITSHTFERFTKNTSFKNPTKFLGTKHIEFDEISDKINGQMFDNSIKSKKYYTSATWNTAINLKNEFNNITDLILVKKGRNTSINSSGIGYNATRIIENITYTFKRPYDLFGTENKEFNYTSVPLNNEQKIKETIKSLENKSKTSRSLINPHINIETTSYSSNTLKYGPKKIRNAMFTMSFKVTQDPRNMNIPSTEWNITKKYGSHINSSLKKYNETEIRDKSIQPNKTRNKAVQRIKAFLKYTTSEIPKKLSYIQPFNFSGNVNTISSNKSDGLNSNNTEDTTKGNESVVNRVKITIDTIFPLRNVKDISYSTVKPNSNTIEDKLFTKLNNAILEQKNDYMSTTKKYTNDVINTKNIEREITMKNISMKSTNTQYNGTHKFENIITNTSPMAISATDAFILYNAPDLITNKLFEINLKSTEYTINTNKLNKSSNKISNLTTNLIFPQRNVNSTFENTSNNNIMTELYNAILKPRQLSKMTISSTKKYGNSLISTENMDNKANIKDTLTQKTTKRKNFGTVVEYSSPPIMRSITYGNTLQKIFDPLKIKVFITNSNTKKYILNNSRNEIKDYATDPILSKRNTKSISYSLKDTLNLKNIRNKTLTTSYNTISDLKFLNSKTYKNSLNNIGNETKVAKTSMNTIKIQNIFTRKYESVTKQALHKTRSSKVETTKSQNDKPQELQGTVRYTAPMTRDSANEHKLYSTLGPINNKMIVTNYNDVKNIEKDKNSIKIRNLTTNSMFLPRNIKTTSYSSLKYNFKNIKEEMFTELYKDISESKNDNNSIKAQNINVKYDNTVINTENINIDLKMKNTLMKTIDAQNNDTQKYEGVIKYTSPMTRSTTYKYIFHNSSDRIHNKVLETISNNTEDILNIINVSKRKSKIKYFTTNTIFPKINLTATTDNTFNYRPYNMKSKMFPEFHKYVAKHTNVKVSDTMEKTTKEYEYDDMSIKESDTNSHNITVTLSNTTGTQINALKSRENIIKHNLAIVNNKNYKKLDNFLATANTKLNHGTEPINNVLFSTKSSNTKVITNATKNMASRNEKTDLTANPIFLQKNVEATLNSPVKYNPQNIKDLIFTESYNAHMTNVAVPMLKNIGMKNAIVKLNNIEETNSTLRTVSKLKEQIPATKCNVTNNDIHGITKADIKQNFFVIKPILSQINLKDISESIDKYIPTNNEETLFKKPYHLNGTTSTVFERAIITTNDKEFVSNPSITKNNESKDRNIDPNKATLQNIFSEMFDTVQYTPTSKQDTKIIELNSFDDSENVTLKTTFELNDKASFSNPNNTEMYDNNAKVTKTQDTKLNLIAVHKKEHTPRYILKYRTKTGSTLFLAHNVDTNFEGINKEKQAKIADMKSKNPNENALDISKIPKTNTNQTNTHKSIVIALQSTTASNFINTSFEKPVTDIQKVLKPNKFKNVININKIKDQQIKPTPTYLDNTIKSGQTKTKFIIFQNSYNETDNSEINSKIKASSPGQSSTKLYFVNAIDSTLTSTINAYSENISNFHVSETVFGNILKSINYTKLSAKPNITKHSLNYFTENSENSIKASNVTNSIFLQNITTITAGATRYNQFMLNETWLKGTGITIYKINPELRKNKRSEIKNTFNNNLTTRGHKPNLKNIASKFNINNFKSLTKAMSMKYFTSKPYTSLNTNLKIESKIKKVMTNKNNKSSYLKTIWPLYVTEPISNVLQTSPSTDLLKINTTGLQEQVIQRKVKSKPNKMVTELNNTSLEGSKINLKELQISEKNTKKLMLSKVTPALYLQTLSKPLDVNTDITLKVDFHPVSSNSTSPIGTPEVSKIHGIYKLITAAAPYTVSVTTQSFNKTFRPILSKKAINNGTQNHTDKNIAINDFLYAKPVQKLNVFNKFFSDYVAQSELMNANDTIFTTKKSSSVISSNLKLETIKTFAKPTITTIFKLGDLHPVIFPTTNDTTHSKSGNLKTLKPDEFELSIRVGIETTKDGIQFSLVGIDEKPTKMSYRVDPKSTKIPSKSFVLPISRNRIKPNNLRVHHLKDSKDSEMLTLVNLNRRANKRNDIAETITLSNNIKQINPTITTKCLEKEAVTVRVNMSNETFSNITSTTVAGNKKIAIHSTVLGIEEITKTMNVSSTVQPIWRQHKKIVIKPSSLIADSFTKKTLKQLYENHLQKFKNITNEMKMTTQMNELYENILSDTPAATKKYSTAIHNEEKDTDSLFKENIDSEDDSSMLIPYHDPNIKIKSLNTQSTTYTLRSHDNLTNIYQYITATNIPTHYQHRENKTVAPLVIKDVNLHNNSKSIVEDHEDAKYHSYATVYIVEMDNKIKNKTYHATPSQNKIAGKRNESITKISNIYVGKTTAIKIKKRNKSHTRKRKKIINALKYKNGIAGLLKNLVKTKKLDMKVLNSTNKNNVIHSLLSEIRKPTIYINKTYMQNKSRNRLIETNYKRLSDVKLHEGYISQIDKPTRKSYFSHVNDTRAKLNNLMSMENENKLIFNRTFAMTSTINITEVTKKPEQNKSNSNSFFDIKLDEIIEVPNSTKTYAFLNQSLDNNLQKNPVATSNQIEVKNKITKPDPSIPILLNIIHSNITNPTSLTNIEIEGRTEFTKNKPVLDNDSIEKLKLTTLPTTNMKSPTKTHYITIKISIPYLTFHENTKKTSNNHLLKTKINNNEYISEPITLTAMFDQRSKDSIDPLIPTVLITNATKINLRSTIEPQTFRDSSRITHSMKIQSDFASKDRKINIKYVHQMSSTTDTAMNKTSDLKLKDLYVRRNDNKQNKSVTKSSKHDINDINSNISNESKIKYDIDEKNTEVYSAISNTNYSSITPNTSVLLNLSDINTSTSNTEHLVQNGTNLNITRPPKNHFVKSIPNEILPRNNSELPQIKKIYKIVPGETLQTTNLFPIKTKNYTGNLESSITPAPVTNVLNLGENNLKLDNNPISAIRTRAYLNNKTSSNRLDLNVTHELNFTTPSILTTVLEKYQDDPQNSITKHYSSNTLSKNNLKLTATTSNPTMFSINNNVNTDPLTTTVKFRTIDNSSLNIALISNYQSSSMFTTKRISNKRKENNLTLKIILLNDTPNVPSTKEINLNETTSLIKKPYTTRHENLSSFEFTYRDASKFSQDSKEKIMTKSSFTAITTSTTNQANTKTIYKKVTQNPNKIQIDAMSLVRKLDLIQTPFTQTEIMPSLPKIKNATEIDITDKDTEMTTSFTKLPFNLSVEEKTLNRTKLNFKNFQNTTQAISSHTKAENNNTIHFIAVPLNTVSLNHIISNIYILDPKTSKSIWNRHTTGNKMLYRKTTKIYQKSNKTSENFTNQKPLSRSTSIKKVSKNTEDMTVTMASLNSEINTSDDKGNHKTRLSEMIKVNLKSYLSKIAVPRLFNNGAHQKELLNQFKLPRLQNKISHNLKNTFDLDTTRRSSKPKISGLTEYVTQHTKYTSKDDRFLPTLHKSTTETNLISTRKVNYNPLSTIFAESGSIEGKNVKIYSSRLNKYHFLRPPLTVTNHIKYNTYQPPTEEDIESLTFKPRLSPRPNVSCAILKTMRHKFHSTYEFTEFLKASNCSVDNLTIHFNIKNNRFLKPPPKQNPNRKINNIKHPIKKLTKKVFTKLGSKESLLNSFEKTKLFPVKPAKAVLPKLPHNIVKRINIGGPKKKEVISMNTRDFFSQHRLATPSHSKNQNIKVRQNNPLLVNTRFSIVRPKFNPLGIPRKTLDRPKTFFLPPRNEEETFAEIYEAPLHHKKLNWKQRIGSVRAALKNNPAALFPSQIKASVSNVLDKPHTHLKTDWDIFRDKTDLSKKKLWGPPDFVPVTWPPTYDLSLPKPLTPTADEYSLRQLQYRRNFQMVTPTLKDELLRPVRTSRRRRRTIFFLSPTVSYSFEHYDDDF